ncbi:MAG: hypothetical protein ACTSW1_03255, partial [Candidatus Hodarchaeales archaeon]
QMSFEVTSYLQMTNYHFKSFYSFNQSHLLPSHSYGKTDSRYYMGQINLALRYYFIFETNRENS